MALYLHRAVVERFWGPKRSSVLDGLVAGALNPIRSNLASSDINHDGRVSV